MSKLVKQLISNDLSRRYEGLASACVVELTGLDVQTQEKIRRDLRAKSARLEVVKNSLAKHAFANSPLAPLGSALSGPCALVTSRESLIEVAKLLVETAKEFKALKLKQAIYEGDPTLITVEALAKMRGKREILGELAMLMSSPARALAGCIRAPQAKIAGCIKTIADKAA
jgi:large subunit ribosomal protein L10